MTAAARALETERPDPLLSDPFARSLAGERGFDLLDRGAGGPMAENGTSLYVLRHRFFDDVLMEVLGGTDIRQVALVAAGLDTRAFRLTWPQGTRLFEIDQPAVLAHKRAILEAQGAVPRCDRYLVAADLREDWPRALASAGLERDRPTFWVAEGLLFYLPEAAVHRLLDDTFRLSAPGSYLATDLMSASTAPPQEFKDLFASLGAPFLYFTDDPAGLLRGHGWDGEAIEFDEVGRRVGIEFPRAGRLVIARR
jgi:methyltransferase (TIGR00027 family)